MKNESFLIRKEKCPKCAELGKDRNGDNFGVYSDSHCHCFSCGYTIGSNLIAKFLSRDSKEETKQLPKVFLPEDCDTNYPTRALDWCRAYEIQRQDLLNHNTLWSESEQRLIFPVYGDGFLIAYQGRDFSLNKEEKRPKWFGRGNLKDTFNILGKGETLVFTEDIISAIKVSRFVSSMPIYGSHIGTERFKRLCTLRQKHSEVLVWLDPDKRSEALVEARRGSLMGFKCRTILSDKDPKEHSYQEIKEILNNETI